MVRGARSTRTTAEPSTAAGPPSAQHPPEPVLVPEILEIRVHGIANTPPAEMLEVESSQVVRGYGDDLGSFWRRADDAPDAVTGVSRTEAYSWGAMARTGGSALAVIQRVLVHIGWLFILPFGLCNLAYWVRPIPEQDPERTDRWRGGPGAATLRLFALVLTLIYVAAFMSVAVDLVAVQCFAGGAVCETLPTFLDGLREWPRAARAAVFSLLPVIAMLVIYLIARSGRVTWEPSLTAFAKEHLGGGKSVGVAGEEGAEGAPAAREPSEPSVPRPLLATPGFWTRARTGPTSERLHFAAVVALVLLLICWDAAFARVGSSCLVVEPFSVPRVADAFGSCLDGALSGGQLQMVAMWTGAFAALLLALIAMQVGLASQSGGDRSDGAKRALAGWSLGLAGGAYVAYVILAAVWRPGGTPRAVPAEPTAFSGLVATPSVLLTLALGLVFLTLAIGTQAAQSRQVRWVLMTALGIAFAAAVIFTSGWGWVLLVALAAAVVLHFWSRADGAWRWYDLATVGWRGFGLAVGMLAALLVAMMISSLLVLGVERWLDPAAEAEVVAGRRVYPEGAAGLPAVLVEPVAYGRFAVVLSGIVVVVLGILLFVLLKLLTRLPRLTVPRIVLADPDNLADEEQGGELAPTVPYAGREPDGADRHVRQKATSRRTAALLHRGEPLVGWIAVLSAVGFLLLASPTGYRILAESTLSEVQRAAIREASIGVLAAVAVAAVGVVAAFAATKAERPLALFWDVMCFFPRAGHPFAPPCYAERAVPELTTRMQKWYTAADLDVPDDAERAHRGSRRGVIIGAHSMGSVVSAAAIFALTDNEKKERTPEILRLGLITYGTQLRAYFSRFFPDILGPDDLGITGTRGPSLVRRDPWTEQVLSEWPAPSAAAQAEAAPAAPGGPASPAATRRAFWIRTRFNASHGREYALSGLLGMTEDAPPRWVSLWRRTDYLGFPVQSYNEEGNPIDRGASEYVPAGYSRQIATHGDYLGTAQYREARGELVEQIAANTVPTGAAPITDRETRFAGIDDIGSRLWQLVLDWAADNGGPSGEGRDRPAGG